MKSNSLLKTFILSVIVLLNNSSFGQKSFKGVEQKYTFQVDTSYWVMAGPKKVARKIQYDKESKGVDTKYEYIFCTNDNEMIDRPTFSMMVIPTTSNAYEETKVNFSKRAQIKLTELDTQFKDYDRTLIETMADDKRKIIAYTSFNSKAQEPYYSCNITFFRDKYILMYVLSATKDDFLKVYEKFSKVALSTKF